MATSTVLLAACIGAIIGWIAHTLVTEPDGPQRERHLIDAYSQGWRACETFAARRGVAAPILTDEVHSRLDEHNH